MSGPEWWSISRELDGVTVRKAVEARIPEEIERAAALAALAGESRAEIGLPGCVVEYRWDAAVMVFREVRVEKPRAGVPGPDPAQRRSEAQLAGIGLMRCLPGFQHHPLITLRRGRTYALPPELLPSYYVDRFQQFPTQLDGNVLFKYHDKATSWFQLPASNPTFQLPWTTLWGFLRERGLR